jgi:serpin B
LQSLPAVGRFELLLLIVCACGGKTTPDDYPLPVPRDTNPNVSPADVTALGGKVTTFGIAVLDDLATRNPGDNVVISPYSIASTLAMTYVGAAGTTASEMASALDFPKDAHALAQTFDAVDLSLAKRSALPSHGFVVRPANALWGQQNYGWAPAFIDMLAADFGAPFVTVDFQTNYANAIPTINDWVSLKTDGIVPNLLGPGSLDSSTRIVLVDALALRGTWLNGFESIADKPFQLADGSTTPAAMMQSPSMQLAGWANAPTFDAIAIPFNDDGANASAMVFVVPKPGQWATFDLAATDFVISLVPMPLDLTIPAFSIDGGSLSLKPTLQALGMNAAFTKGQANFSGMTSQPLVLDDVVHQAHIRVDQNGVIAASATSVTGAVPVCGCTPAFVVNRPFYFAIVDLTSTATLFLGRFVHP